tara:strand:+ start:69724 stop:70086 length:363 start_codon:yes stop_codon:yes gene_type:complete
MNKSFDIEKMMNLIKTFAEKRDWDQFHSPKNISMALAVESSELLEIFQWLKEEQSWEVMKDEKTSVAVKDEIADVAVYLLRLCDLLSVDLENAIVDKMKKNGEKYPSELVRGSSKKYDEY